MRFSLSRLAAMLTAGWVNPSRLAISVMHPFPRARTILPILAADAEFSLLFKGCEFGVAD